MNRINNLDWIIHWLLKDMRQSVEIPSDLHEKQQLMRALMNIREPRPASSEFLKAQDAELQMQLQEKEPFEFQKKGISLWQGDITRLKVDAIVNAANAQMLGCFQPLHSCIDNCIHSAAGVQLREECNNIMKGRLLPTSHAVITKGYNLPAKYVIHTVGPIIADGKPTERQQEQLAECYRNCLKLAEEDRLRSVAFCCISTGVYHFPNEMAAETAVKTVREHLSDNSHSSLQTIVFNVFIDKDYDLYTRILS